MKNHIIVAVHGIHTGSENWSDKFRRWVDKGKRNVAVEEYDFGRILGLQMYACGIFSPFGWRLQKRFADWIAEMLVGYETNTPYSIVAHSFGTWLTHGTLWRYPLVSPSCVVLFGSVLSSHYKKTRFPQMFERKQIRKIVNFWSPHDTTIEHFSRPLLGISPFGHLGSRGWVRKEWDANQVEQVKTFESHGGYWASTAQDSYFRMIESECLL